MKLEDFKLLPCPFCGAKMVLTGDHHGDYWEHEGTARHCFNGTAIVYDETDMKEWNTREAL